MDVQTNFAEAGAFLKEHWPYVLAGTLGLLGFFYLFRGSSAGSSTSTVDAGTAAQLGAQLTAQQTTADLQTTLATISATQAANIARIQADQATTVAGIAGQVQTYTTASDNAAKVQEASIAAAAGTTVQLLNDQASVANATADTLRAQTVSANQALAAGFSNFVTASGSEVANVAAAAAALGAANDATAGNTLGKTFAGIGQGVGAALAGAAGINYLTNAGLNMLGLPFTRSNSFAGNGGQGFVDSGTWDQVSVG